MLRTGRRESHRQDVFNSDGLVTGAFRDLHPRSERSSRTSPSTNAKEAVIFERLFTNLSSVDALLILLVFPILFVMTIFGWMLLIGRNKDTSQISLSAFGVKIDFTASKRDVERRTASAEAEAIAKASHHLES